MNDDLISRKALRNEVDSWGCNDFDKYDFLEAIDNAPTVEYTFEEAFQKTVCEQRLYCPERPQGEWEDYSEDFYKCPECGYLLNKLCPQCHNTVILPKGDADMKGAEI